MADHDGIFHPVGGPFGGDPETERLFRTGQIEPRLSRTSYFDGRLLTAADLNRDQSYLDSRLREVGLAGGSGIVQGLEARLTGTTIEVAPGVAVARSGRTLLYPPSNPPLTADLGDRGLILTLNRDVPQRLSTGLYAVVLMHSELAVGTAEVFPRDLGARRELTSDAVSDALEIALVPLPVPLPYGSDLAARAVLVRSLVTAGRIDNLLPDDGVALGVVAIRNDVPIWFDPYLLRRRRRSDPLAPAPQENLADHYEHLFDDVAAERAARGLSAGYAASEYFHLLPPVGRAPKLAFDPEQGTQTFFPEGIAVHVAPVPAGELEHLRREALLRDPIDLDRDDPGDVIVTPLLSDDDFDRLGRALEREPAAIGERTLLPRIDPLRLRLFPRPPVHELDTDAQVWRRIWERVGEDQVHYFLRPHHASAVGASAVVLAAGFALPPSEEDETEDVAELRERIEELEAARRAGEEALVAAQRARRDAEQALEALRQREGANEERIAALQRNLAARAAEAEQLRQTVAEQAQTIQTLRRQLAECQRDGFNLNDRLRVRLEEIETLNRRVAERDRSIVDLRNAEATLGGRIAELTRVTEERDTTIEGLRGAVRDRDAQIVELSGRARANELQIEGLRTEMRSLESRLAGATRDLAGRDRELAELRETVSVRGREIETLRTEVETRDRRIAGLNTELRLANERVGELDRRIRITRPPGRPQ